MADNRPIYEFGDILLSIDKDGSDITVLENGFACDPTLNMSAMATVFTEKGWWGNSIIGDKNEIGSDIDTIKSVTSSSRREVEDIIKNSLQYLLDQSYVGEVSVKTSITADNEFTHNIKVTNIDGTEENMYWKYVK